MYNSVPAHIHPHMSKSRLLLETNEGINEQCLQWVPCMPGSRSRTLRCWCSEPAARGTWGSYRMTLSRWYQEERSQHSPQSLGGPQVRPKVLVAQHT